MPNLSQFSTTTGFDLSIDHRVYNYIYGLSDFWSLIFQDYDKINLSLKSQTLYASDIYNHFLQLCSSISLEDVAVATKSQLKLVTINSSSCLDGVSKYTLPTGILSSRFITNRPLLPTVTLEDDIGFRINVDDGTITFCKPINQLGFPTRINSDGTTDFAMWFVDTEVDEKLVYEYFAKLIAIDEETSSENFKNFIIGLFYLYTHGPNLSLVKRGLNMVLGIPAARESETVLDIRTLLNTDNFIIITDLNSYVIPYGLVPTVSVGDSLVENQELATWVEVKDVVNDGDWWLNFMIPSHLMPNPPPGHNRYASSGTYADYLMREYLSKHTFLVNVKTTTFKNIETFSHIADIIKRVKPTYTSAIYVWTLPSLVDKVTLNDETIYISTIFNRCESVTSGIDRFTRNQPASLRLIRGCSQFMRFSGNKRWDTMSGMYPYANGFPRNFDSGTVEGFIAPQNQFKDPTDEDVGKERISFRRNNDNYCIPRNFMSFTRGLNPSVNVEGLGFSYTHSLAGGMRAVYIYTTTLPDVVEKFATVGAEVPDSHWFTLFQPSYSDDAINELAINEFETENLLPIITANFDYYFSRKENMALPSLCPLNSYENLSPSVSDFKIGDYLLFIKVDSYIIGVYWVTSNLEYKGVPYISNTPADLLEITLEGYPTRGRGLQNSPYFYLRGAGGISTGQDQSINSYPINEENLSASSFEVKYSDDLNSVQTITRADGLGTLPRVTLKSRTIF